MKEKMQIIALKWHTDGIGQNINQQNEWFVVKFVKFQIAAHLLN